MISIKYSTVLLVIGIVFGQTDITNDPLVIQLKKNAQYAASAYCNDEQLIAYNCTSCKVEGTKFIRSFNSEVLETRGYLARNDFKKELIVSFRGTANKVNRLADLDAVLIPYGTITNPKGNVHKGFYNSMLSMILQFLGDLKVAITKYPEYSIIVTGHSLGGAIASLAIDEIRANLNIPDNKIELYTYGQPKTGDILFAIWYNNQKFKKYRVVNNKDIVPHIYLQNLIGYQHHFHEIWIKGYNQSQTVLDCRDILFEDPECSVSIPINQLNSNDHSTYFDTAFGTDAC